LRRTPQKIKLPHSNVCEPLNDREMTSKQSMIIIMHHSVDSWKTINMRDMLSHLA